MGLLGERPPQYFLNQVKDRQVFLAKQKRNVNNNKSHDKYNATRTAWFKLASGVSMEGTDKDPVIVSKSFMKSGIKYPKKYVLFNGTSYKGQTLRKGIGSEDSYDTSDKDFGVVPMPGVTGASIKCLNRGSIKEAHIDIVCWSKRQFEIIDSLYLRLGYDMLFEWGWSNYVSSSNKISQMGSTLINSKWWKKDGSNTDYAYWLKEIELLRKKYEGNYGGFFGKVVNFDWTFESNGSYKIKLKLITHGDVIESLTLPPSSFKSDGQATPDLDTLFNDVAFKDKQIKACVTLGYWRLTEGDSSEYKINAGYWKDALSSHLANLMLVGKGISNFVYGKHRNIDSGDSKLSGDSRTNFDKNYKSYRIEPATNLTYGANGYKPRYITHVSKTEGAEYLKDYKSNGYGFYGRITGTFGGGAVKPFQGNTYMDSFVLYTNTFTYNIKEKKIISPDSDTYVRLQYLLWYIKSFCIYSLKSTKNPIVNIAWNDPILMYCFPNSPYASTATPNVKETGTSWTGAKGTNMAHSTMGSKLVLRNENFKFVTSTYSLTPKLDLYGGKDSTMGIEKAVIFDEDVGNHIIGANIYLNVKNLLKNISSASSVKDEGKTRTLDLFSLMKTICDEINECLGGVNNLAPIIDTETNTLHIQDQTNFPSRHKLYKKYGIDMPDLTKGQLMQVYGYRRSAGSPVTNFVRKMNLQTKIDKNMATMITIGATASGNAKGVDATGFSKFNAGKINRFSQEIEPKTDEQSTDGDVHIATKMGEAAVNSFTQYFGQAWTIGTSWGSKYLKKGDWVMFTYWNSTSDGKTNNEEGKMTQQYTDYYQYLSSFLYSDANSGAPQVGFLPFSLSLEVDGIDGIKIYNKLDVDTSFLPKNYPTALEFIVKGVDHKLGNNDWTTNITTISVPKSPDQIVIESSNAKLAKENPMPSPPQNVENIEVQDGDDITELPSGKDPGPIINSCSAGWKGPYTSTHKDVKKLAAQLTPSLGASKAKKGFRYISSYSQIKKYVDQGFLVKIGNRKDGDKEFAGCSSSLQSICNNKGNFYLLPEAAQQFEKWSAEMKSQGVKFLISSALRWGKNTGGGPHGMGLAVDFSNLFGAVKPRGSALGINNTRARISSKAYKQIAQIGAKYGWYNPRRLMSKPKQSSKCDELWHFEYWGLNNSKKI